MNTSSMTIRWTVLTILGLSTGVLSAILAQGPIEAIVGMMIVGPIVTLLAGAILGTSQWLGLRTFFEHARLWILATCVGMGVGLILGVVTVERIGDLLAGHRLTLIHLQVSHRAIALGVLGTFAGLSTGAAQWLLILRRNSNFIKWAATSGFSLGFAFLLSSLLVDEFAGGLTTRLGLISFVLLAGLFFGAGTGRSLRTIIR